MTLNFAVRSQPSAAAQYCGSGNTELHIVASKCHNRAKQEILAGVSALTIALSWEAVEA